MRRRPAGQRDRDDVDVFEEAAICRQDLTTDCAALEWSHDFDVGIDARSQVVIAGDEDAVRFQVQIEMRLG